MKHALFHAQLKHINNYVAQCNDNFFDDQCDVIDAMIQTLHVVAPNVDFDDDDAMLCDDTTLNELRYIANNAQRIALCDDVRHALNQYHDENDNDE